MSDRWRHGHFVGLMAIGLSGSCAVMYHSRAPEWAASALVHPVRRASVTPPSRPHLVVDYAVNGIRLAGWRFPAEGPRRATVVYLHGVGDNRAGSAGIAARFTPLGFDVIAYDSRAHGESTGEACTYGYYEKHDLIAVLDTLDAEPVILMGHSLGAAVALQAAAHRRVTAVVAAETFSDLRTIASERAPRVLLPHIVSRALAAAERLAHFEVDEVSPLAAARRVTSPVVIIHGAADVETPPSHSERVFAALPEPKRLLLVPDVGHSRSLTDEVLNDVVAWVLRLVETAPQAN